MTNFSIASFSQQINFCNAECSLSIGKIEAFGCSINSFFIKSPPITKLSLFAKRTSELFSIALTVIASPAIPTNAFKMTAPLLSSIIFKRALSPKYIFLTREFS